MADTPKTFHYDHALATWKDYARWRLNDLDETAPFLWDETYMALFNVLGPVEAIARVSGMIATVISQRVTSFGEAAGIRFSKRNMDYYEELADIIRAEPPWTPGLSFQVQKMARVGRIKTSYDPCSLPVYDVRMVFPCPTPS